MIRLVALAAAFLLLTPDVAQAGPLAGALAAVGGWFSSLSAISQALVRLVVGLALNAITRALAKQPKQEGIKTEQTLAGGTNPDSMAMGYTATAGAFVCPWVMWGSNNDWNVQIIDLAGVPISAIGRFYVNGKVVPLGSGMETTAGLGSRPSGMPDVMIGYPALGEYDRHLFVKFYDGSQTTADPYLLQVGAADPDFPWTSDMVGIGRTYAIVSYRYNRDKWQGIPQFRFEVGATVTYNAEMEVIAETFPGAASFYDMRKDSINGGSGAHRLENPATWEPTNNPMVAVAHLALGYVLPDGNVYGGGYDLSDLPLADWAAAMNKCDALVTGATGQEPAWRAGIEFDFSEKPLDSINALLQVCDGEIVDVGGQLFPRVGAPALPVAFITDGDIIVSQPEDLDPFPGLEQTVNGVAITHPDPDAGWASTEAPQILNPALEAEDGDRRLVQSITVAACPYPEQAQRLGQAIVRDARRFLQHGLSLPGDLAYVRPLQTISWTSARNGYTSKLFEVGEQIVDLYSYQSRISMREVDPADYDQQAYLTRQTLPLSVSAPLDVALFGAGAQGISIFDGSSTARRPAIRVYWNELSAAGVEIEITQNGALVGSVMAPPGALEAVIADGVLPNTTYAVRARPASSGRPASWSGPFAVTTPDVRLGYADLQSTIQIEINAAQGTAGGAATTASTALSTAQNVQDRLFNLDPEPGTSFETLLNELAVGVNGTSATITDLRAVEVDVQGFSAGFAGITVETSGGHISGFKATSWSDPDGTGGAVLELLGDVIVPGTLSTNKLTVGLQQNLLPNPDFLAPLGTNWAIAEAVAPAGDDTTLSINAAGQDYAWPGFPTLKIAQSSADATGDTTISIRPTSDETGTLAVGWPVAEGDRVSFSARVSTLRCALSMAIEWYDATDTLISRDSGVLGAPVSTDTALTNPDSLTNPDLWPLRWLIAEAPALAVHARPVVVKGPTLTGANSSAHVARPMLAMTHASATSPTPYSPAGTTLIDGNRLITGSVHADVIGAGQISAQYLNVDTLVSVSPLGGFSLGKTGYFSDELDGIFMGDMEAGSPPDFGFAVGYNVGGDISLLKGRTGDGLTGYNLMFFRDFGTIGVDFQRIAGDVMLIEPRATGTFAAPGGNTLTDFPDLGPGFWECWAEDRGILGFDFLRTLDSTLRMFPRDAHYVSFVAEVRPFFTSTRACTIGYTWRPIT